MGGKKAKNNIQKKQTPTTKEEVKYEPQPDVQLTPYTLIAMLAIAVSGAATTITGAVLGNPFFYWFDMIYRKETNDMMLEVLSETMFLENKLESRIKILLILAVVLAGITAVISLVDMIRAMVPEKKPLPAIAWIALGFSVASAAVFFAGCKVMYDNSSFANFNMGINFNIYTGAIIANVVNIIFMIVNVIGNYKGLKRFNKDGKAY